MLSSLTQRTLQLSSKLNSGASLCGALKSFSDCNIKHSKITWLELILSQYFRKDKSSKGWRLYWTQLIWIFFCSLPVESTSSDKQLNTLVSLPVEVATDSPALWDVSRKFQEQDAIYGQTDT